MANGGCPGACTAVVEADWPARSGDGDNSGDRAVSGDLGPVGDLPDAGVDDDWWPADRAKMAGIPTVAAAARADRVVGDPGCGPALRLVETTSWSLPFWSSTGKKTSLNWRGGKYGQE